MSRVGNSPIPLPPGISVVVVGHKVTVNGPLGQLVLHLRGGIEVDTVNNQVVVKSKKEDRVSKSIHGLSRTLIFNMVKGVDSGWEKKLELVGVGYRAQILGDKLSLRVGFSHPIEITAPSGIHFSLDDNTRITISGIDKQLVGSVAADIRKIRPPEPYKGKGIRYEGEYVRRKVGKAGKVTTK